MAESKLGSGAKTRSVKESEKDLKRGKKNRGGFKKYLIETGAEMKKIVWPTPKAVLNNTVAVLIFMLIVGVFIWILDALTSTGINYLIGLFAK